MALEKAAIAPAPTRVPDLTRAAVRGVLWTGTGSLSRQFLQVVTSLVLARLLAPNIFGLLGMAMVFVGLTQLFVDFGLGLAIVQLRELPATLLSSCFWLSCAVAGVAALLLCGLSPAIAAFYHEPIIVALLPLLAVNLVLSSALTIPQSLLQRDMRFAALAKAMVISSIAGSAVAIVMAFAGFGVWSLVVQPLVGTTVMLVMLFLEARWYPRWDFSWASLHGIIRFTSGVLGSTLLNYLARNGDSFLIGRFLGSEPLGYYSMAYQLMLYPLAQVSNVIGRVTFPMLAQLQNDLGQFRRVYLQACAVIAFVTFPMMAGLFVTADQFVPVVLGPKWLGATMVLKILCPVGMMQSIATTVGNIYTSTGQTRIMFFWTLATTPILLGAFALGLIWGIEGVAACYAIASTVLIFLSLTISFRLVDLKLRSLAAVLWRPLACSILMAALVVVLDQTVLRGMSAAMARLAADVIAGVVFYALLSLSLNRRDCEAIFARLKAAVAPAAVEAEVG